MFMKEFEQPPEIRMKNRVTASEIKIGIPSVYFIEIETIIKGILSKFDYMKKDDLYKYAPFYNYGYFKVSIHILQYK